METKTTKFICPDCFQEFEVKEGEITNSCDNCKIKKGICVLSLYPQLMFCKVRKGTKKPFEADWTNKLYTWEQIQEHIKTEQNFGVLCGHGDLAVVDCDDTILQEAVDKLLPKTYQVQTGGGGTHNYYFVPGLKKKIILSDVANDKHLGEVQSFGTQVVAPGSIHPNGKLYVEKNSQGIVTLPYEELVSSLKPFMKEFKQVENNSIFEKAESKCSDSEIDSLSVANIWGTVGLKHNKNGEYYGSHPIHGSEGGMNFWINPMKNVWHCMRCDSGGGVLSAIAVKEGIIDCSSAQRGALRGDKAREAIKIAQEKYGLKVKEEIIINPEEVNFLQDEFFDNWAKVKGHNIKYLEKCDKLVLMAHNKNKIVGKPIPVQETIQTLIMVQKLVKESKDEEDEISFKFFDDKYDARKDGYIADTLLLDFWVYKTIFKGREYILLSKEQLSPTEHEFFGMAVKVNNVSEINKNLKIKAIANFFIVEKAQSTLKKMSNEEMVNLCKSRGLTKQWFIDYIFTHPRDSIIYDHTEDYNLLTIAQILSGEFEGYPLHRIVFGAVGTGKTTELECIDAKFQEEAGIFEAGNSTIKGLIPSFKEKPASPGYILKCNRFALIDEMMKMINNMALQSRYSELLNAYMGQLNMLLEHKERSIGSGNDNSFKCKATARTILMTNPIPGKTNIYQHVGLIDETTLSRFLIWIQDKEQVEKIDKKDKKKNVLLYNNILESSIYKNIISTPLASNVLLFFEFQNIVDNCQNQLSIFDQKLVKSKFQNSLIFAKEPMKRIWRSRGFHHSLLLLDGIIKFRCLFQDYDPKFEAKECDYDDLERLLVHMVKTWDSSLIRGEDVEF